MCVFVGEYGGEVEEKREKQGERWKKRKMGTLFTSLLGKMKRHTWKQVPL